MEKLKYNPEEQAARDIAAEQIRGARSVERENELFNMARDTHKRGIIEYVAILDGLTHYLSYVKSLSFGKVKLLDIGTGYGRAISELAENEDLNYNLEILGTTLRKSESDDVEVSKNVKISLNTAETLKSIKDGEIGGILSVYGIGHSLAPELVVKSIDRVLMPLGVLKTSYIDSHIETVQNRPLEHIELLKRQMEGHRKFEEALSKLGYDIAIYKEEVTTLGHSKGTKNVMVALKPPIVGISAKQLLSLDMNDVTRQLERLDSQGFKVEPSEPQFDESEDYETFQDFLNDSES